MANSFKELSTDMRKLAAIYEDIAKTYDELGAKEEAGVDLTQEEQDIVTGKIIRLTQEVVTINNKY